MEILEILEDLGLEEKEAKVYLALLSLGEATATKLAERTGLDRTLMYQLTNKLIVRGLVSYVVRNNVRYFSAADPETFLKELHEKEEKFKRILPELKERQRSIKPETKVEVYRGKEGINTIYRMVLREKKPYYLFGGGEEACTRVELINRKFVRKAVKEKIPGKILERKKAWFFVGENEEYRFIPDELISSTTTMLWNDKTAIFVWSEPYYVILIENPEITRDNLTTFNYLWKNGEKPTQKDRKKRLIN